jgi:hypothetical protein
MADEGSPHRLSYGVAVTDTGLWANRDGDGLMCSVFGFGEQCLRPVDEVEGPYPPGHLQALKQDRRANAGREGTTRAHDSSWRFRR